MKLTNDLRFLVRSAGAVKAFKLEAFAQLVVSLAHGLISTSMTVNP